MQLRTIPPGSSLITGVSYDGQTSNGLANNEHPSTPASKNHQALGTRSLASIKPGWWVDIKFRYASCYRPCRTMPLSPLAKKKCSQPRVFSGCLTASRSTGFTVSALHGGSTPSTFGSTIPNPLRSSRVRPIRIQYIHESPLIYLQSFLLSFRSPVTCLTPQSVVSCSPPLPSLRSQVLVAVTPCIWPEPRNIESIGIRIDMGHIIKSAAVDQGPLLNRVSMAQYTIAVLFVLVRSVPILTSHVTILTHSTSFLTRGFIVKKFGLDDLFIFIAIVCRARFSVGVSTNTTQDSGPWSDGHHRPTGRTRAGSTCIRDS